MFQQPILWQWPEWKELESATNSYGSLSSLLDETSGSGSSRSCSKLSEGTGMNYCGTGCSNLLEVLSSEGNENLENWSSNRFKKYKDWPGRREEKNVVTGFKNLLEVASSEFADGPEVLSSNCSHHLRQVETFGNEKLSDLEERIMQKFDHEARRMQTLFAQEREKQCVMIANLQHDLEVREAQRLQELRLQVLELRHSLDTAHTVISRLSSRVGASPPGLPSGCDSPDSDGAVSFLEAIEADVGAPSSTTAAERSVQSLCAGLEELEARTRRQPVVLKSTVAGAEAANPNCRRDTSSLYEQHGFEADTTTGQLAKRTAHAEEVSVDQDPVMTAMRGELRRELVLFKQALENESVSIDQQPECLLSRVEVSWSGISHSFENCSTLCGPIDADMLGPNEHDRCSKDVETNTLEK